MNESGSRLKISLNVLLSLFSCSYWHFLMGTLWMHYSNCTRLREEPDVKSRFLYLNEICRILFCLFIEVETRSSCNCTA